MTLLGQTCANVKLFFAVDSGRLVPHGAYDGGEEVDGASRWGAPEAGWRSQGAPGGAAASQVANETGSDYQTRPVLRAHDLGRREVASNVVPG